MGRTRDVSKILTSNTSILSLASASSTYQTKASNALVLLNTTSFTTQTTVSINDVFSATYDSYFIITSTDGSTTAQTLGLRMRVSGSDNSSNNYSDGNWGNNSESAGGLVFNSGGSLASYIGMGAVKSGSEINVNAFNLHNPFSSAKRTHLVGHQSFTDTNYRGRQIAGILSVTTSYTGFTLFVTSGTITGNLSVYGYNK